MILEASALPCVAVRIANRTRSSRSFLSPSWDDSRALYHHQLANITRAQGTIRCVRCGECNWILDDDGTLIKRQADEAERARRLVIWSHPGKEKPMRASAVSVPLRKEYGATRAFSKVPAAAVAWKCSIAHVV